jgi:hypothetical protein
MRSTRLLLRLVLGTGLLLSLIVAPTEAQTPAWGILKAVRVEIAHLDFHTAPGYEMMWVAMNVGCGLVNITPDGKFVATPPSRRSSDGLLTFSSPNVLFHDGTKVDAAAVKFGIDRWRPGHRSACDVLRVGALGRGADPRRCRFLKPVCLCCTCCRLPDRALLHSPTATQEFNFQDRSRASPARWWAVGRSS